MRKRGSKELRPLAGRWGVQGGCTIGKTTRAGGSAERDGKDLVIAEAKEREDDACWWECRGRQPFAGARGVLASSFLPAAAGGNKGGCNSPGGESCPIDKI